MNRLLLPALVSACTLLSTAAVSAGDVYGYTDEHGRLWFVDSLDLVPARYRQAALGTRDALARAPVSTVTSMLQPPPPPGVGPAGPDPTSGLPPSGPGAGEQVVHQRTVLDGTGRGQASPFPEAGPERHRREVRGPPVAGGPAGPGTRQADPQGMPMQQDRAAAQPRPPGPPADRGDAVARLESRRERMLQRIDALEDGWSADGGATDDESMDRSLSRAWQQVDQLDARIERLKDGGDDPALGGPPEGDPAD